jgi:hypothetical protein
MKPVKTWEERRADWFKRHPQKRVAPLNTVHMIAEIAELRAALAQQAAHIEQLEDQHDDMAGSHDAALCERAAALAPADLYAALRAMHWSDGRLAVVQASDLTNGIQTYSGDMLDEAIKAYMEGA